MNEQDFEIDKYDLEYKNVTCTGVQWETKVFYFTIDKKEYKFLQKEYVDCNSDTDHIRYVIEYQFLPWLKEHNMQEEIARLTAENDKLRAKLENAVELKAEVGDKLYMPWVYDGIYDIATLEIVDIELTDNEITYITDLASDNEGYLAKYNYGNFSNGDFDNMVFTDYNKAEAKLKEIGDNV